MAFSRREQFISAAIASYSDHCIIWPFAVRKSSGYPAHSTSRTHGKRSVDAHRYVCELVHGEPNEGDEAAHSCGNKLCINPNHLSWQDHLSNMDDAKRHGTLRGGGRYRQRFFADDIAEICASSDSLLVLAAKYSSDVAYIGRLKRVHG